MSRFRWQTREVSSRQTAQLIDTLNPMLHEWQVKFQVLINTATDSRSSQGTTQKTTMIAQTGYG